MDDLGFYRNLPAYRRELENSLSSNSWYKNERDRFLPYDDSMFNEAPLSGLSPSTQDEIRNIQKTHDPIAVYDTQTGRTWLQGRPDKIIAKPTTPIHEYTHNRTDTFKAVPKNLSPSRLNSFRTLLDYLGLSTHRLYDGMHPAVLYDEYMAFLKETLARHNKPSPSLVKKNPFLQELMMLPPPPHPTWNNSEYPPEYLAPRIYGHKSQYSIPR